MVAAAEVARGNRSTTPMKGSRAQNVHKNKHPDHGMPPLEDLAATLRDHLERAEITRAALSLPTRDHHADHVLRLARDRHHLGSDRQRAATDNAARWAQEPYDDSDLHPHGRHVGVPFRTAPAGTVRRAFERRGFGKERRRVRIALTDPALAAARAAALVAMGETRRTTRALGRWTQAPPPR